MSWRRPLPQPEAPKERCLTGRKEPHPAVYVYIYLYTFTTYVCINIFLNIYTILYIYIYIDMIYAYVFFTVHIYTGWMLTAIITSFHLEVWTHKKTWPFKKRGLVFGLVLGGWKSCNGQVWRELGDVQDVRFGCVFLMMFCGFVKMGFITPPMWESTCFGFPTSFLQQI